MENTSRNKKLDKPASVTIEYARRKLGGRGEKMTEQQISDLLSTLRLLCNKMIDSATNKNYD